MAAHGGASQPRSVSSHLDNFFDLHDNSLLSEDPEGNMVLLAMPPHRGSSRVAHSGAFTVSL